ncbi:MAG: hypothetical protein IKW11_00130, partial [Bacteroidales bacterium]|nr:hypothetical protein [Bacteroidales bacterium]
MRRKLITMLAAVFICLTGVSQPRFSKENEQRAADIVSQMTLQEKAEYVGGFEDWYIRAIDRLGLPAVRMADGPQGV